MNLYFTDFFDVGEDVLDKYGAFNVSLVVDLPLFIDPFLLFNSKKPEYQALHNQIIAYVPEVGNDDDGKGIGMFSAYRLSPAKIRDASRPLGLGVMRRITGMRS